MSRSSSNIAGKLSTLLAITATLACRENAHGTTAARAVMINDQNSKSFGIVVTLNQMAEHEPCVRMKLTLLNVQLDHANGPL
jgi:hypothetical protein